MLCVMVVVWVEERGRTRAEKRATADERPAAVGLAATAMRERDKNPRQDDERHLLLLACLHTHALHGPSTHPLSYRTSRSNALTSSRCSSVSGDSLPLSRRVSKAR